MSRGTDESKKNSEMAARMKRLGITRKTGKCPICNKEVPVPMDRHLFHSH